MAKHRLEIDISFDNKKDAIDILNLIEEKKNKAYKPKGDEKILCHRKTRYHSCTHDELNPAQCGGYINVDFEKPKEVYT